MLKSIVGATCACLAVVSFNVSAVTYTTTVTAAGDASIFDVSGINDLEWLDLTATNGQSRLTVEDRLTSDLIGWRYASRQEVETLFDSLWGGTSEGWHESNYAGAHLYIEAFGINEYYTNGSYEGFGTNGNAVWNTHFGNDGECNSVIAQSCRGHVEVIESDYITDTNPAITENSGWFSAQYGLSYGENQSVNVNSYWRKIISGETIASHLVKVSAVPIPSAVWLFGSGLIGLIGLARRRA